MLMLNFKNNVNTERWLNDLDWAFFYRTVPYRTVPIIHYPIFRLSILGHTPLPFSEYIVHKFVNIGTSKGYLKVYLRYKQIPKGYQKGTYRYQGDTYMYLQFPIFKDQTYLHHT